MEVVMLARLQFAVTTGIGCDELAAGYEGMKRARVDGRVPARGLR